ncbi:MAG: alpha/beta hydrolase [Chlorobi bacterium]|nr:alpha/beta hydrolase [Chlorobiota bacterium]
MKKRIVTILSILLTVLLAGYLLLYFGQEKMIFFPEKLDKDYEFAFSQNFIEMDFKMDDNVMLHGILFKADSSKGLVFYLHGNAGSLKSWGEIANTYTDLDYDLFMLDYRGYGKSEGKISSEGQLYSDIQKVYDILKNTYDENNIVVLGYSIGTGPAAKLASTNHPKLLILQAPYFNLTDLMKHYFPVIPSFALKYKFETNKFIRECKMPVIIFHGDRDEVVHFKSSLKLKGLMKNTDRLIVLKGQGHNGMSENRDYLIEINKILNN